MEIQDVVADNVTGGGGNKLHHYERTRKLD